MGFFRGSGALSFSLHEGLSGFRNDRDMVWMDTETLVTGAPEDVSFRDVTDEFLVDIPAGRPVVVACAVSLVDCAFPEPAVVGHEGSLDVFPESWGDVQWPGDWLAKVLDPEWG